MNYEMFTDIGDIAVGAIVRYHNDRAEVDHSGLYDLVLGDLERLQTVTAFAEATDTDVREAVYQICLELRPVPVFRSVRNKTVDTV